MQTSARPAGEDPCLLPAGPVERPGTLTVALSQPTDLSHAPVPTNDSERLLFRRRFETLITVDCEGEARPGLARDWRGDSTGRAWTFTLRPGARKPDGSTLTAEDVVSTWEARKVLGGSSGIESVMALDGGRIMVRLAPPGDSVPRLLAQDALAVATVSAEPASSGFRIVSVRDPRDALDQRADLVITREPATLEYVSARPEFQTFALPWSRTYVLLQPSGGAQVHVPGADSMGMSLAHDVVRADARPAKPPFWWNSGEACTTLGLQEAPPSRSPRIVYPRDDAVAQALAERIVALASERVPLSTAGLGAAEFASALHAGADRGYVLALPRRSLAPCRDSAALPSGARLQPLIDTRAHAIVRRGAPPLVVEWDGNLRWSGETAPSERRP